MRRSGRTTRLILAAVEHHKITGESATIIAATQDYAHNLRAQFAGQIDGYHVQIMSIDQFLGKRGLRTKTFVDHYTWEYLSERHDWQTDDRLYQAIERARIPAPKPYIWPTPRRNPRLAALNRFRARKQPKPPVIDRWHHDDMVDSFCYALASGVDLAGPSESKTITQVRILQDAAKARLSARIRTP